MLVFIDAPSFLRVFRLISDGEGDKRVRVGRLLKSSYEFQIDKGASINDDERAEIEKLVEALKTVAVASLRVDALRFPEIARRATQYYAEHASDIEKRLIEAAAIEANRALLRANNSEDGDLSLGVDGSVRGEVSYLDALENIHRLLSPSLYLEIGVHKGKSLRLARCRTIGVDPVYDVDYQLPPNTTFVTTTSDEFFETRAARLLAGNSPDLVFIDGMHHFEYALRDFINAEKLAPAHGLIVIDDVIANHPAQATRERRTRLWMGDVWKLRLILREHRPDLFLLPLDTFPAGMLVVAGLNSGNRELSDRYDSIVKAFENTEEAPPIATSREDAVSPKGPDVKRLIRILIALREGKMQPGQLAARLRRARSRAEP